jgi:hypothetical protein
MLAAHGMEARQWCLEERHSNLAIEDSERQTSIETGLPRGVPDILTVLVESRDRLIPTRFEDPDLNAGVEKDRLYLPETTRLRSDISLSKPYWAPSPTVPNSIRHPRITATDQCS